MGDRELQSPGDGDVKGVLSSASHKTSVILCSARACNKRAAARVVGVVGVPLAAVAVAVGGGVGSKSRNKSTGRSRTRRRRSDHHHHNRHHHFHFRQQGAGLLAIQLYTPNPKQVELDESVKEGTRHQRCNPNILQL